MADFGKEVVGGVAGWVNVLALAQANGYTGGAPTTNITLEEVLGAALRVKWGHSSGSVAPVAADDGLPLSSQARTEYGIDIAVAWIYFPVDTDVVSLSFHSDIDF